MNLEERQKRAEEARFVLENPAYIEAVEKFTRDIRSLRLQLSPRDVDGASRLAMMEQAVEKAKRLMEIYLQDGEAARKELEKVAPVTHIGRMVAGFRRR